MSQFDYLKQYINGQSWVKEVLKIGKSVQDGIDGGKEWYFALPHINYIMSTPTMSNIAALLEASSDLAENITDVNLVFLETVHGINRALNSKRHSNLAGTGQNKLNLVSNSVSEQSIYLNAVYSHNEGLNLPMLSIEVAKIEAEIAAIQQQGASAAEQIDSWKSQALQKLEETKNSLLQAIESLTGNAKRSASSRLKRANTALTAMNSGGGVPIINGWNPYTIDSTYKRPIDSIYRYNNIQANAIVPIAIGGAATVAGTVSVLSGIAGWLLSSFFLKSIAIPATLLPALTNTVVSIVLKVLGSTGADAVRYLAASALKAGANLLPVIIGTAGMRASGWAWLMAYAAPMIGAAVIIIQSMRNRLALAKTLLIFGDFANIQTNKFNFTQLSMYDTSRTEILDEFKKRAAEMKETASRALSPITGLGLDERGEYAICYNLTDPENPVLISGQEAIETLLGPDKVARIATNRLGFMDFI